MGVVNRQRSCTTRSSAALSSAPVPITVARCTRPAHSPSGPHPPPGTPNTALPCCSRALLATRITQDPYAHASRKTRRPLPASASRKSRRPSPTVRARKAQYSPLVGHRPRTHCAACSPRLPPAALFLPAPAPAPAAPTRGKQRPPFTVRASRMLHVARVAQDPNLPGLCRPPIARTAAQRRPLPMKTAAGEISLPPKGRFLPDVSHRLYLIMSCNVSAPFGPIYPPPRKTLPPTASPSKARATAPALSTRFGLTGRDISDDFCPPVAKVPSRGLEARETTSPLPLSPAPFPSARLTKNGVLFFQILVVGCRAATIVAVVTDFQPDMGISLESRSGLLLRLPRRRRRRRALTDLIPTAFLAAPNGPPDVRATQPHAHRVRADPCHPPRVRLLHAVPSSASFETRDATDAFRENRAAGVQVQFTRLSLCLSICASTVATRWKVSARFLLQLLHIVPSGATCTPLHRRRATPAEKGRPEEYSTLEVSGGPLGGFFPRGFARSNALEQLGAPSTLTVWARRRLYGGPPALSPRSARARAADLQVVPRLCPKYDAPCPKPPSHLRPVNPALHHEHVASEQLPPEPRVFELPSPYDHCARVLYGYARHAPHDLDFLLLAFTAFPGALSRFSVPLVFAYPGRKTRLSYRTQGPIARWSLIAARFPPPAGCRARSRRPAARSSLPALLTHPHRSPLAARLPLHAARHPPPGAHCTLAAHARVRQDAPRAARCPPRSRVGKLGLGEGSCTLSTRTKRCPPPAHYTHVGKTLFGL
ncbi:hypothetical protein GGX14DRAFT_570280 [Mycena pura]|uniref:Uncharacterized protein n=1 Tax=Mycena pura TaxID=153505 RepID=A0AAD6YAV4_9AGAR|nr:hypothetical protein GGX14DRAFT_570280 [Mycena pura]